MVLCYIAQVVRLSFVCYTGLLFVKILGSWFPAWQRHKLARFVSFCTDPYLNLFRRVIPPIGGVLDLSPILAFFGLRILEMVLMSFFR